MKKTLLLVTLLFLSVLCACSNATGEEGDAESYGGSVIVGITQDLDSLDPHVAVAAGTDEVLFNIFEGLVKADEYGNVNENCIFLLLRPELFYQLWLFCMGSISSFPR